MAKAKAKATDHSVKVRERERERDKAAETEEETGKARESGTERALATCRERSVPHTSNQQVNWKVKMYTKWERDGE